MKNNNFKNYIIVVIFLFVLVITNTSTYFFGMKKAMITRSQSFSFLNPARNFFEREDLIINFQTLRDYLNNEYEKDPNISLYFEFLSTGANIAISKDAEFFPASLVKVPVALAVAKKIDKGEWKWDNKLVLMSTDKDDKFGTLYKEPTGSIFTIEELVRRSLVDSDNTAHFILLRNLELDEINEVYKHIGLDGFLRTDGNISAKRYSVILRALYNSSFLSEDNSQKILSFLSQEPFREFIGSGIPSDVVFAHKIGIDFTDKVYLDAGLVYFDSRPYLLVVMTKGRNEKQSQAIMKDISEKVFNYVKNYDE